MFGIAESGWLFDEALRQRVAANLSLHTPVALSDADARASAVGVVLIADDVGRPCFVLTRRAESLRRHSGQWALPGGRLDQGEAAVDAARREVFEEVGVRLSAESVLGRLDDFLTRSRHLIAPFVFWAESVSDLQIDPNEVAAAYRVPLEQLDRSDNPRREPLLHFQLEVPGTTVYAPTAAILYQFRELALYGRHVRVSDEEQPRFAWR